MLQSIRDSLSGWVLWFVVGLIAVPFAFVGIESFRMGSSDPVLVEVGDIEITETRFRTAYDQRFRQLQQMMGDNFRPDMINTAEFRRLVLADMTQEAVTAQYASQQGYRGSDAETIDYLRGLEAFQRDGRFSAEAYREALSRQGMTPETFEAQLREALAIDGLRDGVLASTVVPDTLLDNALRLQHQERSLSYLTIPAERFRVSVEVDEAAIQARYEQDQARYQVPERMKLDYVVLDGAQLPKAPDPDASVLKALYEAERAGFTTPEARRARHILVTIDGDEKAAEAEANALRAQLNEGADFAALAAEHSDDTGSRDDGGSLGWIERGEMTESFEAALFSLAEGETSGPITTEFGVHLIRVDEIREQTQQAFDDPEVQEALLSRYHGREQSMRVQALLEEIEQLAFENPNTLAPVAEALQQPVQQTDWFTREGGAGILAERSVMTAAFSPELIDADENSAPLALSDNRVVVIRKADYAPPSTSPLADVRDDIRETLIREGAEAKARALADELLAEAEAGRALSELADVHGVTLRAAGPVKRNHPDTDRALLERLFAMPRPAGESPEFSIAQTREGDFALLALNKVIDPEPTAAQRVAERDALEEVIAGVEFNAYERAMRHAVTVTQKREIEPKPL
jgi:peptidyl-prolyl cis-trans isomerase D